MIARVWHGWALPEHARVYERHFQVAVLPRLEQVDGFTGAQLWRREAGGRIEFVAVSQFVSLDAVRAFAGQEYDLAVVDPEARRVLIEFDERCIHFEIAVADGRRQ